MTTQLPERLRDLAEEAPDALTAGDLWRSGRRRHRRRLVTAGAVVGAVVALTVGAGYGDWHSTRPEPTAPPATRSGPMQIPDRLFNPSPWTPATRTPGRLVALLGATRDHFPFGSDRNALVGVAAGSQTYRFLDLPGRSPDVTDAYLSPDGRHVAYWLARRPSDPASAANGLPGLAVLDLLTGRVERHLVFTRFGLAPVSLTWADSSTLVLAADHFASTEPTSYAGRTRTYVFTLGQTSGYSSPPPSRVLDVPVDTTIGYAQMVGHRRMRFEDPRTDLTPPDITLSAPVRSAAFDVRRHLMAVTEGNVDASGSTSGTLMVGRLAHRHVVLSPVPGGRRYQQVMTWVDPSHVATERQTRQGIVYDVVDVRTGERRELTSKPWYAFTVAVDALQHAATVSGIEPPSPWNPRWVALGGLGALVLAGGALVVVRRSHVRR